MKAGRLFAGVLLVFVALRVFASYDDARLQVAMDHLMTLCGH